MKNLILTILSFFFLSSCGQIKDSEKILVPGTRIYIEKPESFELATDFIGFESDKGVIMFMDLYGGNYYTQSVNYTKENFERGNVKVFDFKEFTLNGYSAKLVVFEGDINTKIIGLIFGEEDFSVSINARVVNEKVDFIKKKLLTIEYDKNRIVGAFEAAFFELDDSESIYKHSMTNSNLFLYTKNGVKKDNFMNESTYLVTQTPLDSPEIQPKQLFEIHLSSLVNNGLIMSERISSNKEKLNGFKCYEELITGILNGKETHIIMTSVVFKSRGVIISGVANDDFELTLKEFEKLTRTLKMK